ncbi:MAG: hypothetical protein CM1200mP26_13650 [Acidimicrobiales bacterium]|nr:MAG: hypothetical protein CM1200mP26_13650 [Acidimicrobiales bacterium]
MGRVIGPPRARALLRPGRHGHEERLGLRGRLRTIGDGTSSAVAIRQRARATGRLPEWRTTRASNRRATSRGVASRNRRAQPRRDSRAHLDQ